MRLSCTLWPNHYCRSTACTCNCVIVSYIVILSIIIEILHVQRYCSDCIDTAFCCITSFLFSKIMSYTLHNWFTHGVCFSLTGLNFTSPTTPLPLSSQNLLNPLFQNDGNYEVCNIMRPCYELHVRNVKKEFSSEAVLLTSVYYDIAIHCNMGQVSH